MYISTIELLKHIKIETSFLIYSKFGNSFDDLLNDEIWKRAVVRSIEIIGEASKKIDDETKYNYSQIEWKAMAKMRDKLIHHYFGIDYEIVWDILENKIEELDYQIELILNENEENL